MRGTHFLHRLTQLIEIVTHRTVIPRVDPLIAEHALGFGLGFTDPWIETRARNAPLGLAGTIPFGGGPAGLLDAGIALRFGPGTAEPFTRFARRARAIRTRPCSGLVATRARTLCRRGGAFLLARFARLTLRLRLRLVRPGLVTIKLAQRLIERIPRLIELSRFALPPRESVEPVAHALPGVIGGRILLLGLTLLELLGRGGLMLRPIGVLIELSRVVHRRLLLPLLELVGRGRLVLGAIGVFLKRIGVLNRLRPTLGVGLSLRLRGGVGLWLRLLIGRGLRGVCGIRVGQRILLRLSGGVLRRRRVRGRVGAFCKTLIFIHCLIGLGLGLWGLGCLGVSGWIGIGVRLRLMIWTGSRVRLEPRLIRPFDHAFIFCWLCLISLLSLLRPRLLLEFLRLLVTGLGLLGEALILLLHSLIGVGLIGRLLISGRFGILVGIRLH